jgi:predicted outer membrane repeat protein
VVKTLSGNSAVEGGGGISGSSTTIFDYMRLRAAESRYLSKEDEWKIIDNATFQLGLRPVDAKSYLVGAAVCDGFSTESLVRRALLDIARGLRKRSDKISKDKFEFMVESALGLANDEISREEAEDLVKAACDLAALKAKRSGMLRSRRWWRESGSSKQKQQQQAE